MKTLTLYITKKLVFTTFAAIGVLTFVLLSGNLIKVFDLLARGVPAASLGKVFLYLLPVALKYTIPFSVLAAVILVFSRLSADNEITAMRASGVSLWQIISPALLIGIVLSAFSFYLQMSLSPRCRYAFDSLRETEGVRNPLALIEPGRFIELSGYVIYASRRDGDRLRDLHVYGLNGEGKVIRDITAREGRVSVNEVRQVIELQLVDALIVAADPAAPGDAAKLQRVAGQAMTFPLDYGQQLNRGKTTRKIKHMDAEAIFGLIHAYTERGIDSTPLYLELHRRLSMTLAPVAFILIGIPFGVRTRRSETAIGLVIALILAAVFYAFLVLADSMKFAPGQHPEILVWIPNIVYQVGGLIALYRLGRQ